MKEGEKEADIKLEVRKVAVATRAWAHGCLSSEIGTDDARTCFIVASASDMVMYRTSIGVWKKYGLFGSATRLSLRFIKLSMMSHSCSMGMIPVMLQCMCPAQGNARTFGEERTTTSFSPTEGTAKEMCMT